jgi:hypothetical protein
MFACKELGNHREVARDPGRSHFRGASRALARITVGALCALGVILPAGMSAASAAPVGLSFTSLKLENGWTNAPFSTSKAAVETISGIVHFKGAIATAGTNPVPFRLPKAFRPAHDTYVPVDLCNANKGRLWIKPSGVVTVQAETSFSQAQCFTSLDGASFAKSAASFTSLKLQNGWTNAPFSTSKAAVRTISGIVHFKGAIATSGTNTVPFRLPKAFRPAHNTYVPVDLCNANNGRLVIEPSGVVAVEAETNFSDAQCFTSLDGASFAKSAASFTSLKLQNGWTNAPFSTSKAAVRKISGIVHFKGAIATSGTNAVPFRLPKAFRPAHNTYVQVDLCNANKGRLWIRPSGVVTVQAENNFSDAQCFTSLDGASFAR